MLFDSVHSILSPLKTSAHHPVNPGDLSWPATLNGTPHPWMEMESLLPPYIITSANLLLFGILRDLFNEHSINPRRLHRNMLLPLSASM